MCPKRFQNSLWLPASKNMCCYPYPYVHLLAIVASILLWQILSPSHPPSRHLTRSLSHSLTHSHTHIAHTLLSLILHSSFAVFLHTHSRASWRLASWTCGWAVAQSSGQAGKLARKAADDRPSRFVYICLYILIQTSMQVL